MKRALLVAGVIAASGLVFLSCKSTNSLETNQVGWSAYTATVAKDYDAVRIVSVTSTETITQSPFSFRKNTKGSRVLYAQLMDEAKKLGAHDIINVRVDRKLESTKPNAIVRFFIGSREVYTYTATALAIKYKDATPTSDALGTPGGTNSVSEARPDPSLFGK